MPDLIIQSHKGPYEVHFGTLLAGLENGLAPNEHLVVDSRVAELYEKQLGPALAGHSVLRIKATEANKSLECMPDYVMHLIEHGIRRDHTLVAVGGGIIQDIVCFIAATLLRGVPWRFYPTTLLAQADSCIGSKSSINVRGYKNQLGTFTPPVRVDISPAFLDTLPESEVRSGAGEILKVSVLDGWETFDRVSGHYPAFLTDHALMGEFTKKALEIKQVKIEEDEFDRTTRLVMNYGHTFGHAMESASNYAMPHGIAVSMGMDFANFVAMEYGIMSRETFDRLQPAIRQNYRGFEALDIPEDAFFGALGKDKKNVGSRVKAILATEPGNVEPRLMDLDDRFKSTCRSFLNSMGK